MSNLNTQLTFNQSQANGGDMWVDHHLNDAQPPSFTNIKEILKPYQSITLAEMDAVKLLNRVDYKYVMPIYTLQNTLAALSGKYRVLVVNGTPFNHYRTLYFDTPDFAFFNMHVNGQAERYKVRSREYLDSHLTYFEVKHRTRKDRTIKKRLPTQQALQCVTIAASEWLDQVMPYENEELEPKIWNTFTRITLVNVERCERLTIDLDIAFYNENRLSLLEGIAVAEIKMDDHDHFSPFKRLMRDQHIPYTGFSKYCMGTSLLYDRVKKNALKQRTLLIKKISKGANHV